MRRGEVWMANLDPTRGDEIAKDRPVVILNRDSAGVLNLRVVVPLTSWQPHFAGADWLVRLDPTPANGLRNASAADTFQVRSISTLRFRRQVGVLSADELAAVVVALVRTVGG